MTNYIATIQHHSISWARQICVTGNLSQAKRAASREFGDEFADYTIVIYQEDDGRAPYAVASRKVGARRWIAQ